MTCVHDLQHTLHQQTHSLEVTLGLTLQIIHVRQLHWAALKISGSTVYIYDSSHTYTCTSLSNDTKCTQVTIAKFLCCKEESITTHVMNVSKQIGTIDCTLFAMANVTHLALGEDPTRVVFYQDERKPHLIKVLETGNNYITFLNAKEEKATG